MYRGRNRMSSRAIDPTLSVIYFDAHAHATFQTSDGYTWTSDLAWADVKYDYDDDEITILKTWPQQAKKGGKRGEWCEPMFDEETLARWRRVGAQKIRVKRGLEAPRGGRGYEEMMRSRLKGHEQALCSRCQELGHFCGGTGVETEEDSLADILSRFRF